MKVEIYGNGFGTFNTIYANLNDIGIEYAISRKAGVYSRWLMRNFSF